MLSKIFCIARKKESQEHFSVCPPLLLIQVSDLKLTNFMRTVCTFKCKILLQSHARSGHVLLEINPTEPDSIRFHIEILKGMPQWGHLCMHPPPHIHRFGIWGFIYSQIQRDTSAPITAPFIFFSSKQSTGVSS